MSFALTPFATHPFGTTALTGPMTSSGVGSAAGTSTASAVSDLWGAVVFQADFDPVNPAGQVTSPVVDYKGHTVLKGSYPRVTPDTGNIYNSTGGGHLRGQTGTGNIAYVDGLLSEFNGFRLTDKWTLEFRLLVSPSWAGYALSIQATTGGSPLTVFVDPSDTTFGILVKPQNQSTAYATGQIYTAEAYTWHSFIVECDGSSVKIIHDTTQATTTTDTSLSYNSAVANSLTLLGLSKDHSGSLLYLDELRITKAARYGGSGYPASPWPYYNGREGWSFTGSSAGTSTASAAGVEWYLEEGSVATASGESTASGVGSCTKSVAYTALGGSYSVAAGKAIKPIREGAGSAVGAGSVQGVSGATKYASVQASSTSGAAAAGEAFLVVREGAYAATASSTATLSVELLYPLRSGLVESFGSSFAQANSLRVRCASFAVNGAAQSNWAGSSDKRSVFEANGGGSCYSYAAHVICGNFTVNNESSCSALTQKLSASFGVSNGAAAASFLCASVKQSVAQANGMSSAVSVLKDKYVDMDVIYVKQAPLNSISVVQRG